MFRTKKELYSAVIGNKANKSASERWSGVCKVDLYVKVVITEVHLRTARVFKYLTDAPRRTLNNHTLLSDTWQYQVFINALYIIPGSRNLKYNYTFKTNNEVLVTLRDMQRAAMHAWDPEQWFLSVQTIQLNRIRRIKLRTTVQLVETSVGRC